MTVVPRGQLTSPLLEVNWHPLFYDQPGRDTIAACLLITFVNYTATITSWDAAQKVLEFKMSLRDRAISWFDLLEEDGLDVNDWDVVMAEFMETYKPKYLACTTCTNFMDLFQKNE